MANRYGWIACLGYFLYCTSEAQVQGNNPPRLVNFLDFAVVQENAPRDTKIKTIKAIDTDGPAEITFAVDPNSPETQNLVYLGTPTGASSTGRYVDVYLKVDNLDRDSDPPERRLRFEIRDGLNNAVYAAMTLFIQDINDEAPQFRGTPYRATIREDASPGTLVFNGTQTVDPDTGIGGSVSYSLKLTNPAYRSTFNATPYEGHIYLNGTLDYEKHNFYQLQLTAMDGGGLNTTTDVIITIEDVQDTKPSFVNTPYTAVILENATIGTSVISVSALDGDRGNPNPVTYRFMNYSRSDFRIDANTGEISVNSKLDSSLPELRNQGSVFDLTVEARETVAPGQIQKGETTATMLVLITLQDVNDHAPVFNRPLYSASVLKNAQKGTSIQLDVAELIYVQDQDQGMNSKFAITLEKDGRPYYVFSPQPRVVFHESAIMLKVNSTSELTQAGNSQLNFTIVAIETATPEKRSGSARVHMAVLDNEATSPQCPGTKVVSTNTQTEHNGNINITVIIN